MSDFASQQVLTATDINTSLQNGRPVDLSRMPRFERLQLINAFLEANALRPLEGLGDSSQGQIEFVGINGITPDPFRPGAFVTRVDFQCNKPRPEGYNHLAFFNAGTTKHSGVIIVPVINDEFVLMVQQYRPALGRVTLEIPRGFTADLGNPNEIKSYGAALKELHQETGIDLTQIPHQVRKEFTLFENTGTSNIANAALTIGIQLSPNQLELLNNRVVQDLADLDQRIKTILVSKVQLGGLVNDNHTAAALFKGL
jgi:hypothetical protein